MNRGCVNRGKLHEHIAQTITGGSSHVKLWHSSQKSLKLGRSQTYHHKNVTIIIVLFIVIVLLMVHMVHELPKYPDPPSGAHPNYRCSVCTNARPEGKPCARGVLCHYAHSVEEAQHYQRLRAEAGSPRPRAGSAASARSTASSRAWPPPGRHSTVRFSTPTAHHILHGRRVPLSDTGPGRAGLSERSACSRGEPLTTLR